VTRKRISLVSALVALALSTAMNLVAAQIGGAFKDNFALPGGVLGWLASTGGLFDTPSMGWAVVCVLGNLLFYAALWWAVLAFVLSRILRKQEVGMGVMPSNKSLERTRDR
jgi:hypothetical protein